MSRWLALADAAPYRAAGKPVWAVALSFNGRTRQFKGACVDKFPP